MSQQQSFGNMGTPGTPSIEFVQGNTGVPIGANPATFTIDILGDTAQGVSVDPAVAPFTQTITVQNATAAQTAGTALKGVSSYDADYFNVTSGFVSLNGLANGQAQTVGAVTADVITLPLGATPGTYALEGRVAGFESTTPASAAFQIFGTVRTTGAAAVLVGVPDYVSNDEAAVNASDASLVVSGNNAIIRVTGVAALTINWGADLQYTFRG